MSASRTFALLGLFIVVPIMILFTNNELRSEAISNTVTLTVTSVPEPDSLSAISVDNISGLKSFIQLELPYNSQELNWLSALSWSSDWKHILIHTPLGISIYKNNYQELSLETALKTDGDVQGVQYNANNTWIAFNTESGIYIFDTKTKQYVATLTGIRERVNSFLWSTDNSTLIYSTGNNYEGVSGAIYAWKLGLSRAQRIYSIPNMLMIWVLDVNPKSQDLAFSAGLDVTLASPSDSGVYKDKQSFVTRVEGKQPSARFSPDGVLLAYERFDSYSDYYSEIHVFDTAKGAEIANVQASQGRLMALAFNPSGTILVSGGSDGSLLFWDTRTWERILETSTPKRPYNLAFNSSGTLLATVSTDGIIRFWGIKR